MQSQSHYYEVKIKDTKLKDTIKAKNELEAKVKFCKKKKFDYRVYAPMLKAKKV